MATADNNGGKSPPSGSSLRALASNKIIWFFGCLIAAAVAMRVWGLSFGLPQRYHVDEIFYVALALKLPSNSFDMAVTTHGPNLFYMILLAEYVLYLLSLLLTGQIASIAAFEQLYRNDPTNFVLLARLTSAIAGTLTLIPVYFLGKKLYNSRMVGLVAAVLLAFTFQHIRESHYGTPDVFVALLVTICLLATVSIVRDGRYRDYILAGVFAGLAAGTKFTNGLLWLPLLAAHIYQVWAGRAQRSWLRELFFSPRLWTSIAFFVICFAIAYPNLVLRPGKFLEYVTFLIDVGKSGFISQFIIEPSPAWFYYPFSLSWGMGLLMLAMVIMGVLLSLLRHDPAEIIVVGFVIAYLLFLTRSTYYASRYLDPFLPVLTLLAANSVFWLADGLARHIPLSRKLLAAGITILLLIQPLSSGMRHNYLLGRTDTRTLAKVWIEENIPEGTAIAVDWRIHAPPLRTIGEDFPESSPQYDLVEAGGIGLPKHTLDSYNAGGVHTIVVSSFIDRLPLSNAEDIEARSSFHESLASSNLVYEVKPYEGKEPPFIFDQLFGPAIALWQIDRPGPTLKIYQMDP